MSKKRIAIIVVSIIVIIAGVYLFKTAQNETTRIQVDTLYTYFHKIQDSIKKKNYPINMDSLKKEVHDSMMRGSTFKKLMDLDKLVSAYKQP